MGHDDFNTIAGRRVNINARMGALEVSIDKDWARYRASFFYASGDDNPRNGTARGFDAIFDDPAFAGGGFSFWQSQGIHLTGTNVDLTSELVNLITAATVPDAGEVLYRLRARR